MRIARSLLFLLLMALVASSTSAQRLRESAERGERYRPGEDAGPGQEEVVSVTPKATAVIDVLVVYARAFFTQDVSALEQYVRTSINDANQAFFNSGIDASYNLVGIVPLLGEQPTTNLYTSLNWLTGNPSQGIAVPAEVAALRTAFGADVVALYIDGAPNTLDNQDACGLANEPLAPNANGERFLRGNNIVPASMGNLAFSVHRYGCGQQDYTLAHEIGHNYGMGHHDDDPNSAIGWLYPYARGKVLVFNDGTQRATIMGCACTSGSCGPGPNAVCNRIPYFSNPSRSYTGPNGQTLTTGDPDRDNARAARDNVARFALFYNSQAANPAPDARFSVSCSGRICSFTSTSTDNATIPSNNYWWDFGDGSGLTRGARTIEHSYPSAGSFRVHLVVRDSGGKTDVGWGTATTWNPVYEGYHEASSCASVQGWAWDQVIPNTPINVDIYRDGSKIDRAPANLCRQDLLNAGKGNGCHGFDYSPSSAAWRDGQWHTVSVLFPGTNTALNWTGQQIICNASMFYETPTENLSTGGVVYTVGTQFSSNRNGYITRLWFWRATGETGTNTLRLWTDNGVQLASVTTSCTTAGWCAGDIVPVYITANTLYRVTVNTNTYQAKTGCGLGGGITRDPLTAHSGYWAPGDTFPDRGSCSNFFVDVSFDL